ncbi:acyltransferase family protein [Pseudomonas sp. NMS19W]|uniref:acyltransferase family protein n=1 Tax=Pseudomonas sp. NMS19W TaxID=3079768 RepID=UPI003F65CB1B
MSNRKNLEIEYLRGAAVVMTFLCHVTMMLPFHTDTLLRIFSIFMPWTGVDLFFCISGFVVSKAYLDYFDNHRAQGQSGLATVCFWLRRAYRLLPTAWLWILVPLLFSIVYNQSNAFGSWYDNLRSFTAVATFSGNLGMHFNSLLGPSPQYWSLALEEQFYFVFPLFLLFVTSPAGESLPCSRSLPCSSVSIATPIPTPEAYSRTFVWMQCSGEFSCACLPEPASIDR